MTPEEYKKSMNTFSDADNEKSKQIARCILENIYDLENKNLHKESAIYITEQSHLTSRYNTFVLETIFKDLNFKVLSSWSLVALLRNTFWSKDRLPRWYDLLNYTIKYYDFYYLNKKDLFGLY